MDITGTIEKIFPVQEVTASFKKREVVIRTEEQYPQPLIFEFAQDKTSEPEGYNEGDKVKISFDIRGREWKSPQGDTKYFISLRGWRLQKESPAATAHQSRTPTEVPNFEMPAADFSIDSADDDLPF
jgi:hypothetical protein